MCTCHAHVHVHRTHAACTSQVDPETAEAAAAPLSLVERTSLGAWAFSLQQKYDVVGRLVSDAEAARAEAQEQRQEVPPPNRTTHPPIPTSTPAHPPTLTHSPILSHPPPTPFPHSLTTQAYLDRLDEFSAQLESEEQRRLLEAAWESDASSKD